MLININSVKKLMKHSEISHWIDHLSLNMKIINPKLHAILWRLDLDNSNTQIEVVDGYSISYVKSRSRNGEFLNITISIRNVPYTIFQYLEYPENKKKIFNSQWLFTLYSTYFRLLERGDLDVFFINSFLWAFYEKFKYFPISRMDYRLDFFFKENHPFPKRENMTLMKKNSQYSEFRIENMREGKKLNKYAIYSKWWLITWRTCWSKKNKSVYIRMYDKLIDSKEKGKFPLYDDYFMYKKVYRLECEFRTKFNKKKNKKWKFVSYQYYERRLLERKCMAFFGLKDTDIKAFVYQYKSNDKIEEEKDIRYLNDFGWRACALALKGMNPFTIILGQFIMRESIRKQIKKQLLETLLMDFDQRKEYLISKIWIFKSWKREKDGTYKG